MRERVFVYFIPLPNLYDMHVYYITDTINRAGNITNKATWNVEVILYCYIFIHIISIRLHRIRYYRSHVCIFIRICIYI